MLDEHIELDERILVKELLEALARRVFSLSMLFLNASGATTLTDLKEDGFRAAGAMVRAMKDMEKDTRDALFNAIATLFRSNIQAAVEEAREEVRGDGSPLRKLTELTEKIVGKE